MWSAVYDYLIFNVVAALLVSCRSDVLPIPSEDGGEPLAMEELQRSTLAVYLASLSHFEFSNSWVCLTLSSVTVGYVSL